MKPSFSLILVAATAFALPNEKRQTLYPEVTIDYGTFRGHSNFVGVHSWVGMPYAEAGRFQNPRLLGSEDKIGGVRDATRYGPACPQQQPPAEPSLAKRDNSTVGLLNVPFEQAFVAPTAPESEDCLSINVQVPQNISHNSTGLPVIFWIHGGGFLIGSSAGAESGTGGLIYQGANIVQQSIDMGQPIIFVSANYRLNGFGGLASQEIVDAGVSNLLLKDQRAAMRWVQRYIRNFGGDPEKVTLYGQSAGALSIPCHMVLNDGDNEGLFRAAIMASGGASNWRNYTGGQATYDFLTAAVNCTNATSTLDCLRTVPYEDYYRAVSSLPWIFGYTSLAAPWWPKADGQYLVDSPHNLAVAGKIANVPFIIGDLEDEGTLFTLAPASNTTTEGEMIDYFNNLYFPQLSRDQVARFVDQWSSDIREGSPFGTGEQYNLYPQFKRMAAILGDYVFHVPRRVLLKAMSNTPSWTYLQRQSLPVLRNMPDLSAFGIDQSQLAALGSFHTTDIFLNTFGTVPQNVSANTRTIMSTYIAFVNNLDPNTHGLEGLPNWPQYNNATKLMYNIREDGNTVITDDFRESQMEFVMDNSDLYIY